MPVLLRTSERGSFTRCRWAWDRGYNDCVKPHHEAPALRFGSLVHGALERYYKKGIKRGPHPAATFRKLYDKQLKEAEKFGFRDEEGTWQEAGELGEDMLNHYVEHYGADDRWQVLATEMPFQVPVLHPRTGRVWFLYVGIIDLVVRDRQTKFVGIADHKTIAEDPVKATAYLALDDQAGAYWRYGRQALYEYGALRQDVDLNGLVFNFLRKAKKDTRPRNAEGYFLNKPSRDVLREEYARQGRKLPRGSGQNGAVLVEDMLADLGERALLLGEVSKVQPAAYFYRETVWRNETEGERVHQRVLNQYREIKMARQGKLAIYKNPGKMNCNGCGYRDICELDESGADWRPLMAASMDEWDPYAAHEIYDRN